MSVFTAILLIFVTSQLYWAWRGYSLAARRIQSRAWRMAVCTALLALYLLAYKFNLGSWRERETPVHLTLGEAVFAAPFLWWAASSLVAFLVVVLLSIPRAIAAALDRILTIRRAGAETPSPARRQFLGRTAALAAGAPFVAGAYGLLYGRLNLETTAPVIRLPRLPRPFEGFRICQLSDIHIGPFMPAEEP